MGNTTPSRTVPRSCNGQTAAYQAGWHSLVRSLLPITIGLLTCLSLKARTTGPRQNANGSLARDANAMSARPLHPGPRGAPPGQGDGQATYRSASSPPWRVTFQSPGAGCHRTYASLQTPGGSAAVWVHRPTPMRSVWGSTSDTRPQRRSWRSGQVYTADGRRTDTLLREGLF